jgi:zinc protease
MKKMFIFLLSIISPLAAQVEKISVPYSIYVLPNGLTVILHEDHSIPVVGVNIWYHVGSSREKPGRTGFAHLFEHLMFEGSAHVPEGMFDQWLEAAGGDNNGSTNEDRTNYWENVPNSALELPLFLESDRMGYLLDVMTPAKIDGQRDVVKNERRQSYENRPYGLAFPTLSENLYPKNHPYNWPTIGSMADLSAASYEDVADFFKKYYLPNNASLVIAGDIDKDKTIELVKKWFNEIKPGPPVPPIEVPPAKLDTEKRIILEDKVQLPRLYMAWLTPAIFTPGDAEMDILGNILADGKSSRLYKKLVYELQIAQDVMAFQSSNKLSSEFIIMATARSGHNLDELEKVIQDEINLLKNEKPSDREVQRAVNSIEAAFIDQLETNGGFGGKADELNRYFTFTGKPDYFNEDLSRYRTIKPGDIKAIAGTYLKDNGRVILSIVPQGKKELAASNSEEVKKP